MISQSGSVTLSSAEVQEFVVRLYQSAVRSVPQAQSRMDRSGGCVSISRTSLSFSRTSMDFSTLAKFDSLKLTETHG